MRFIHALAKILKANMPEETILMVSSLGEGQRLLREAAADGNLLVGIRPMTPSMLAQEICSEYLFAEDAPRLMETAEAQDLLFHTLSEMPEEGFFALPHAKSRKTAELMFGIISELGENDIPMIGGNARQDAIQALREAYQMAKGASLMDAGDLAELAAERAPAYFCGRNTRFAMLGSEIFSAREQRLINAASSGCLQVIPVGVSGIPQIPKACAEQTPERFDLDIGKLRFVRCRGTETEQRFILRDILSHGRKAEDCAVICMSSDFAPGLYAEAQLYHIPVTVSGGLPLTGSYVYYALSELDSWAAEEYDAEKLRSLILSGAIQLDRPTAFARRLRDKNIGWGKDRYTERFLPVTDDESCPPDEDTLAVWKDFLDVTLKIAGKQGDFTEQKNALDRFLTEYAAIRREDEASANAKARELLKNITWLGEGETVSGRLLELMERSSCMAGEAEPGKLYVTSLADGFCTGRKILYICGMSRFCMQGSRGESPLLLDEEKTDYGLPAMTDREKENTYRLYLTLSQHEGEVILSYCDYDTERMIELQPSPVYRELSQEHEIQRISCIPNEAYTLGDIESKGTPVVLKAEPSAEPSDSVTAAELSEEKPFAQVMDEMAFSATSLEEALECPLKFYLKRVMGLYPDRLPERSSDEWLDNLEMGSLCHVVLERYYAGEGRLKAIFEEELEKVKRDRPVGRDSAVKADTNRAWEMISRAVRWTEDSGHRVISTEKPFGSKAGEEPMPLTIGNRTIRLSGSIDRVDELPNGSTAILDYKTGRSKYYREQADIKLQPYLYTLAAEKMDKAHKITDAGYLFLKNSAEYFAMPQTEENRKLKEKVICSLLDWMQDEEQTQTAAPVFIITSEDGIAGLADSQTRQAKYGEKAGTGCRRWCEYADLCTAAEQIAAASLKESEEEDDEEDEDA